MCKNLLMFCNVWQSSAWRGNLWTCLAVFSNVWQSFALRGNLWTCLAAFSNVWQSSAWRGNLWTCLAVFSNVWQSFALRSSTLIKFKKIKFRLKIWTCVCLRFGFVYESADVGHDHGDDVYMYKLLINRKAAPDRKKCVQLCFVCAHACCMCLCFRVFLRTHFCGFAVVTPLVYIGM